MIPSSLLSEEPYRELPGESKLLYGHLLGLLRLSAQDTTGHWKANGRPCVSLSRASAGRLLHCQREKAAGLFAALERCGLLEQVPGQDFWVAGVAYAFARGETAFRQERQEYLTEALQEVPDTGRTLLLAHHPEFIDDAAGVGIPLTLTGHTHGGQFGLFGMPLLPGFKYTRGMVHIGSSYGYVHSGNGSWFPMRIGCPPEIAYFTLAEGE